MSAVPAALVNLLGVDLLAQVSYQSIVTYFFDFKNQILDQSQKRNEWVNGFGWNPWVKGLPPRQAFGLLTLVRGIAALSGPPIAGESSITLPPFLPARQ